MFFRTIPIASIATHKVTGVICCHDDFLMLWLRSLELLPPRKLAGPRKPTCERPERSRNCCCIFLLRGIISSTGQPFAQTHAPTKKKKRGCENASPKKTVGPIFGTKTRFFAKFDLFLWKSAFSATFRAFPGRTLSEMGPKPDFWPVPISYPSRWVRDGYEMGTSWVRDGYEMGTRWVRDGYELGTRWVRDGYEMGARWVRGQKIPNSARKFQIRPLRP